MTISIRPAVRGDAADVAKIDLEVNASPLSEAQCKQALNGKKEQCLLAAIGDSIEGFVLFTVVLDEATILALSVRQRQQKKGIGRALLNAALQVLKESGIARCLLEVRESNQAARHLYTANGFVVDGLRKNYYARAGAREDAVLMSLRLQEDTNERVGN